MGSDLVILTSCVEPYEIVTLSGLAFSISLVLLQNFVNHAYNHHLHNFNTFLATNVEPIAIRHTIKIKQSIFLHIQELVF